ncbi:MAG: metal ABC transporter permease [Sumerlaeia bacterium]
MTWTIFDTWIVITGGIAAMACALAGNWLILRKMSMMGDALSHAVLPGLAVAFLLTGTRTSLAMLLGAVLVGLVTTFLISAIERWGGVEADAAMGVTFTALFAIGLILIRVAAHDTDLDPDCVLYGALELTYLDSYQIGETVIPRAAVAGAVMLLVNLIFVVALFKELTISAFDPEMANTQGINATLMHYLLMMIVAATTVAAFNSVGSILVIAMLVVPGACARLLTNRLSVMIALSLVVAALCAVLGHGAALIVPGWFGLADEANTAGSMATMAGLLFGATVLLAPQRGLIPQAWRRLSLAVTVTREDILGLLWRAGEKADHHRAEVEEAQIRGVLATGLLGRVAFALALRKMRHKRRIHRQSGMISLTERGEHYAARMIRRHRLWEGYLVQEAGIRPDHVHGTAERLEHITDAQMLEALDKATGSPAIDPHEKVIPREE